MKYSDYVEILKKHEEQRTLEEYQRTRILPRPKTNSLSLSLYIALFFICLLVMILGTVFLPFGTEIRIFIFIPIILIFCELYLRFLGIKAVECYQHYASEERRRKCLCKPSCSEYAILCFKKYCLFRALAKIRARLFKTCRGDEYKIDIP